VTIEESVQQLFLPALLKEGCWEAASESVTSRIEQWVGNNMLIDCKL
jgi:hypothetical protein